MLVTLGHERIWASRDVFALRVFMGHSSMPAGCQQMTAAQRRVWGREAVLVVLLTPARHCAGSTGFVCELARMQRVDRRFSFQKMCALRAP